MNGTVTVHTCWKVCFIKFLGLSTIPFTLSCTISGYSLSYITK